MPQVSVRHFNELGSNGVQRHFVRTTDPDREYACFSANRQLVSDSRHALFEFVEVWNRKFKIALPKRGELFRSQGKRLGEKCAPRQRMRITPASGFQIA